MDEKIGKQWKLLLKPSGYKFAVMFPMVAFCNILSKSFLFAFNLIPCKIYEEILVRWSFCPLNPTIIENTLYFGVNFIDTIYVIFYLLSIYIFLPYLLGCLIVVAYQRIMR